jgi:hypothetical protein
MKSVVKHRYVHIDNISVAKLPVVGDTMANNLVSIQRNVIAVVVTISVCANLIYTGTHTLRKQMII